MGMTWWKPTHELRNSLTHCLLLMKEMNKCMDQIKDNLHDIKEKIDKIESEGGKGNDNQ